MKTTLDSEIKRVDWIEIMKFESAPLIPDSIKKEVNILKIFVSY